MSDGLLDRLMLTGSAQEVARRPSGMIRAILAMAGIIVLTWLALVATP